LGVTINTSGLNISGVATAGIVSATTLYGDGTNLTGIALSIASLNYNPAVLGSGIVKTVGIGLTFNQAVKAGSGNVTLRIAGAAGTVVENFGVGNSVTYGDSAYGTTVTIDPTSDLTSGETYHLSYPSGAFTNIGGDLSYVGTAYTFGVKPEFITLWAAGTGEYGATGQNNQVKYSSPVQIPGTNWNKLYTQMGYGPVDHGFALATKADGTLWSWGFNDIGYLAQNNRTQYSSPVQITGTTWATVTVGWKSVLATKTNGTLWGWGLNQAGNLGQNSTTQYSSPVQIPGTTWATGTGSISKGVHYTHAIKTDGTLWAWGLNEYGELGLNTRTYYSSPIQIPGTTWRSVRGAYKYTIATKTDGTLWSWGLNTQGQLGLNNRTNYSSPTQLPGTTWKDGQVALSDNSFATRTDGTLWAWGQNSAGELGLNNTTKYSSPVQVPGTTWSEVGGYVSAIKTDGTLWSWGDNGWGLTGLNLTTKTSSPTQIPGTDWHGVSFFGGVTLFNKLL